MELILYVDLNADSLLTYKICHVQKNINVK
jgi:hypothetical protein